MKNNYIKFVFCLIFIGLFTGCASLKEGLEGNKIKKCGRIFNSKNPWSYLLIIQNYDAKECFRGEND